MSNLALVYIPLTAATSGEGNTSWTDFSGYAAAGTVPSWLTVDTSNLTLATGIYRFEAKMVMSGGSTGTPLQGVFRLWNDTTNLNLLATGGMLASTPIITDESYSQAAGFLLGRVTLSVSTLIKAQYKTSAVVSNGRFGTYSATSPGAAAKLSLQILREP